MRTRGLKVGDCVYIEHAKAFGKITKDCGNIYNNSYWKSRKKRNNLRINQRFEIKILVGKVERRKTTALIAKWLRLMSQEEYETRCVLEDFSSNL